MKLAQQFEWMSEMEIIQKIIAGEKLLYELIMRKYNPCLYKTGRSYGYNHHDTEDLMQETYISAFYNLSKFENRASFKTWIVRIMLNHCYHKQQKSSFKKEIATAYTLNEKTTPMFTSHTNTTEMLLLNKELGTILENALEQIPQNYKMVFALRELSGLNVAETAEALDISESNVKVRFNRAKGMLRAEIEKTYSLDDIYKFTLVYCDKIVNHVISAINT